VHADCCRCSCIRGVDCPLLHYEPEASDVQRTAAAVAVVAAAGNGAVEADGDSDGDVVARS